MDSYIDYRIMTTSEIIDSMMKGTPMVPFPEKESLKETLDGEHRFIHEEASEEDDTCEFMDRTFKDFLNGEEKTKRVYIMMHIPERRALKEEELDKLNFFMYALSEITFTVSVTWGLYANIEISNMDIYIVSTKEEEKKDCTRNDHKQGTKHKRGITGVAIIMASLFIYLSIHLMTYNFDCPVGGLDFWEFSKIASQHILNTRNLSSTLFWCIGWYILLFGIVNIKPYRND